MHFGNGARCPPRKCKDEGILLKEFGALELLLGDFRHEYGVSHENVKTTCDLRDYTCI